jgi:hypothetical protein
MAGIDNPVADALGRLHPVQLSAASSVNALQVAGASKPVPGAVAERPAELVDSICALRSCRPRLEGGEGYCKLPRAGINFSNLQREVEYVVALCGFCTHIMVAIDGFSRFVVLEPATDASGESVAGFRGSQYDNYQIDAFCHLLGLVGMLLWPIGRRQAAWLSESTRKSVGIFGSSAWIDGSGTTGAACSLRLLFSGLSTHSYMRSWSLVDFKRPSCLT